MVSTTCGGSLTAPASRSFTFPPEEYRATYLQVPKIINRKPVFVSETVRDELDRVVRYLGGRGMSASGLIENLVRLHLDAYRDDIEQWRKL